MIRILASAVVTLIASAVALWVGNLVLEDMTVTASGFIVAVLIFTGTTILIEPLLRQMALNKSPVLLGSTALLSTLVALVVTSLFGDALEIDGATTWVLATVLVWIVSLGAKLLLPLILFKKILTEARN